MRVLTSQAETGAVTLACRRTCRPRRTTTRPSSSRGASGTSRARPDRAALARPPHHPRAQTPADRRRRRRHLLRGDRALRAFVEQTGIPVGETQAGKGSLRTTPAELGAVGATGTFAANRMAARCRPGDRHRHALDRLHHGLEDRLPESGRALHQHECGRLRRREAGRHRARRATRARRSSGCGALEGYHVEPAYRELAARLNRRVGRRGRRGSTRWERAAAQLRAS